MAFNLLNVGIPSAILGAIGSGPEQRERADRLAQLEAQRSYQAERLGLDRETLEETRRQANLRYGPATVNVPGIGEITAQREFIPAIIAAASAREKDLSPEEITALTGYRDRALAGPEGIIKRGGQNWEPAVEAEATKQALRQGAAPGSAALPGILREVGPMTVDLPQTNVPRQSFEKIMTETAAQRKEVDLAAQKQKQGLANARYRELYSTERAKDVPHFLADAYANSTTKQELGIAPEREAFVAAPTEQRQSADREAISQRLFNMPWSKLTQDQIAKVDDTLQKEKIAVATASGAGRAEAWAGVRTVNMLDTTQGNRPVTIPVDELKRAAREEPDRYISAGAGVQALNKTALIEDIRGAIVLTRESLKKLKTEFTATQAAQLSIALGGMKAGSGALDAVFASSVGKTLTPDQIDYITNLAQLKENAMAMRSVLGAGQGSDELRAAITATIPSARTPSHAYATTALNKFEAQIDRLARGVPTVPLKGGPTGSEGPPSRAGGGGKRFIFDNKGNLIRTE